jgi:hypothetical protein
MACRRLARRNFGETYVLGQKERPQILDYFFQWLIFKFRMRALELVEEAPNTSTCKSGHPEGRDSEFSAQLKQLRTILEDLLKPVISHDR